MIKPTLPPGRYLLGIAGLLAVVGVLLIGSTLVVTARSAQRTSALAIQSARNADSAMEASTLATDVAAADDSAAAQLASESVMAAPAPRVVVPAPAAPAAPAAAPRVTAKNGVNIDAYRGLGTWIDIYDDRAWADPSAAVSDMAQHGVRTLYIETANSRSSTAIKDPEQLRQFITQAHRRDIKVVAWYLPDLKDLTKDYSRVKRAIEFTTADGQKFDSFALDIESGAVKPQSARNTKLLALSDKIRLLVGPSYPLGAIIPSPLGLTREGSYWASLPYESLAGKYDVIVPMSYYTYHGDGGAKAYADTLANMRILRAKPGCAQIPVHLIGGESEKSSTAEVREFVRAARETGAVGASLYGWAGTKANHWTQLKPVVP